ncbi:hypothetical protein POVWA2_079270 [Plasmodium ovale wallikeri]|uniref:PIR Superfamily Protein n=1 Tax=Plasmodium ovale wallikeri TaxID=864142 RepID=A0A1A9AMZ4_PLAOA|nr:hypothetical protein POVWA2_079270 [Plasmodium ovale wallikeri]SBT57591.1 hypothetical protein POVWA1_082520 [Plasmodium ovale wallikeri]
MHTYTKKISDVFPEITCPSEETTKNLLQQACGKEEPRLPSTLYVTPNVGSSQKIKCEETPSRTALYPVILSICIILLRIILIS